MASLADPDVRSLLNQVLEWFEVRSRNAMEEIVEGQLRELWNSLLNYDDWRMVIQVLIDRGLEEAKKLLNKLKRSVMTFVHKHKHEIAIIAKAATKSGITLAAIQGAKVISKKAANAAVKQGAKSFIKAANPVGIVADVAQVGFELAGYENVGKKVGTGGNILSGALIGGAVAGPPGAVIGAAGGYIFWGIGEVVGKAFEYYMSEEN